MVRYRLNIAKRHGFLRASCALAATLLIAGPALAQEGETSVSAIAAGSMTMGKPQAERGPDEIVVTGRTDAEPAEIRRQAQNITTNTSEKFRTPLAKFQEKVCPGIVGMPTEMAEIIVDRMRSNAERVGLETAPAGNCAPNILVIFVRNGQSALKQLVNDQPYLFRQVPYYDVSLMLKDSGPVHAWVNTEIRSRQGDRIQGDNSADLTKIPVLNIAQSQSHIFLAHRIDITNSVIMIDIPAIDGMSVVQLADYATMRAFARTRPVEGSPAATTILSLFDKDPDAAPPYELTDFDLAYLRTVYQGVDSLNAASKLASITNKLRDIETEALADGSGK